MLVSAERGLAFIFRTAVELISDPDPFDHQHAAFHLDVTLGLRAQMALTGFDLARLQRATQGPGQSTGRRGDDVVEGGGLRVVLAGGRLVVLRHLVMDAEKHRLPLRRKVRPPERALHPLDPNPGDVGDRHQLYGDTLVACESAAKLP
jgi:hypothetical protein